MASIIVRDLDPAIKERFRARAKRNGRSMEAELRILIEEAVVEENPGLVMLKAFQAIGGWEMPPVPRRDEPARNPFQDFPDEESQ